MKNKKKAALVLSGGAALGAVELGIISVLEKDYEFDFFAGTSIGSLISAFLAEGKSAREILEIFTTQKVREIMLDFSANSFGIIRGDNFLKFLQTEFREKKLEDFSVPLKIVATDFSNGNRVNIDSGSLAEAVRASCGIPIVFQPFFHSREKKWLVDGGLSQNFPLDLAVSDYEGDKIIAINVGTYLDETVDFSTNSKKLGMKKIHSTIERVMRIMMRNQHIDLNDARVILFEPDLKNHSAMSLHTKKFQKMFEFGQNFAKEKLNKS